MELLNTNIQDIVRKIPTVKEIESALAKGEKIEFYKANMDKNYVFKVNPAIDLSKQNISKEARIIIALLFRDYWATQEQKNKIELKEKYDISILEAEKVKKI